MHLLARTRRVALPAATCVFVCIAAAAGMPSTAAAFNLEGCIWHSRTIGWNNQASGENYTAFHNGKVSWNNVGYMNFDDSGTGTDVIAHAANAGDTGYDGLTQYHCDAKGFFLPGTTVHLNTYYTNSYSVNERQSVAAHEIGHSMGLAHNNSTTCVLMYYSTNRYTQCGVYTPQQDDKYGDQCLWELAVAPEGTCTTPGGNKHSPALPGIYLLGSVAKSYYSLHALRADATAIAAVTPMGTTTTASVDGLPWTLSSVKVIRQLAGSSLPTTFTLRQLGDRHEHGAPVVSFGNLYLAFLKPFRWRNGGPDVAGQYVVVGGLQGLYRKAGTVLGNPGSRDFVRVDPDAAALPATMALTDAISEP